MTGRTQKLREGLFDHIPGICPERAVIFTRSMKETEGLTETRAALPVHVLLSSPDISPGRPSIAGRGTPINEFEMRTEQIRG